MARPGSPRPEMGAVPTVQPASKSAAYLAFGVAVGALPLPQLVRGVDCEGEEGDAGVGVHETDHLQERTKGAMGRMTHYS